MYNERTSFIINFMLSTGFRCLLYSRHKNESSLTKAKKKIRVNIIIKKGTKHVHFHC